MKISYYIFVNSKKNVYEDKGLLQKENGEAS